MRPSRPTQPSVAPLSQLKDAAVESRMNPRLSRFRLGSVALTALLLMSTGCSWIFVKKPPPLPVEPAPPVACTQSVAAPVLDTIGTVLLATAGVLTIVGGTHVTSCSPGCNYVSCSCAPAPTPYIVAGVAVVGLATTLGFSAASGYSTTARCRDLTQAQASCLTGVEASCRRLGSPLRGNDPAPEPKP